MKYKLKKIRERLISIRFSKFEIRNSNFILKFFFISSILIFSSLHSHSQTLTFCEFVDSSSGSPKNPGTTFTINPRGGILNVLVTMPKGINSTAVTYDIFRVNDDQSEMLDNTIKQNVFPEYTWFSKEITFHKA